MARFSNGWVKLYRSVGEGDLSQNGYLLAVWVRLLQWANWKPTSIVWKGARRDIPAGSLVTGYHELADSLEFSKSTVYKWVKYLANSERIVIESGADGSLVTIQNWEAYQAREDEPRDERERSANDSRTERERSANLIEEEKKERKKDKYSCSFDLESAYQKYPLKQGRTPGLKKLAREIKTDGDYQDLLTAIDRYSRSKKVSEGYIKLFSTFASEWRDWVSQEAGSVVAVNPAAIRDPELDQLEAEYAAMKRRA